MIDKILNFSIQHRIFVVLLTAVIAGYGLFSLKNLPIDAVPDITNNQLQINTLTPSLSPIEVEKQVTYPIENALAGIPGLESTRSISRNGFSQVTAIFKDSVNVYFARQQVNERLTEAKEVLPPGAEPKMGPISTGLGEIYMWTVEFDHPHGIGASISNGKPGWQSDDRYLTPEGHMLATDAERASYLRTVQDWIIKPQLKGTHGVAEIDSIGGYIRQYHVEPQFEKMLALDINFSDIAEALQKNNLSVGAGYIEYNSQSYLVKGDGRIESPEEIEDVVIDTRKGVPIRIKDIGSVAIGKELRTGSSSENGQEVVIGTAMMLIGANSRTVALAVDEKMQIINQTLPPDIKAKTVLNRTKLVDATIHTVTKNLLEGALLVIAVLFMMLGNLRAAFIAAMIIPLSMLMTAIGMVQTKISGNLMSLGALDFGLIVDGAVIITENCLRKLSEKQKIEKHELTLSERLYEVALATKEMVHPTVFGQAIILTVYIPLLTFSGVEGKMFEPMAMTVIFALIAAFILSLTFIPAMIAFFVKPKLEEKEHYVMNRVKNAYAFLLEKALKFPEQIVGISSVVVFASFLLFFRLGQEFVPTLDEKDIALHAVRIPSTSLTQSTAMQLDVEKTLTSFPEVAFAFSKTGTAELASDPMPPNVSDTFVMLKPQNEWPNPALKKLDLIEQIETKLKTLPGNNYEFTQPIEMRFNELIAGVRSDVAVKVYGDNFDLLQQTAEKIAGVLGTIKGAADIKVAQTDGLPTMEVNINRAVAKRLGLNMSDILNVIQMAVGGSPAGVLFEGDRRFDIIVRLPPHVRENPLALENLPIPLHRHGDDKKGSYIPLKEVATLTMTEGLNEITRENGKRVIIVQANVRGNDLGSFVSKAKEKIAQKVKIPPGYWLEWGGQFENLLSARNHLMLVVSMCFGLILVLLYTSLKSIKEALIVFSGVPMALTGGIVAIWLRDMPFSISAAVGFIALSGIAVLNGLVMLTYINQLNAQGFNLKHSITEGALTRLRPVLMTALVASLGFVPMALATGTGAEVQKPLATVVIGGLFSSTLLTLFVLPSLCQLFLVSKKEEEINVPT
ncbi:MAG: CusA/CzcA family heavy metal efflux RND transporter [Parachlamydiaceae bacterium]|nr:CusA/CzcA family heavy metal efflux RND transporter [Parachlamydiaceae bacterium]